MLIREEFAKQHHSSDSLRSKQASAPNYKLLSKMLGRINYFSHFDDKTRQKLLEISSHRIYNMGQSVIHSD